LENSAHIVIDASAGGEEFGVLALCVGPPIATAKQYGHHESNSTALPAHSIDAVMSFPFSGDLCALRSRIQDLV